MEEVYPEMNEIPMQLAHRDMDRLKTYKELLDFYHGSHWEGRAVRGQSSERGETPDF